MGRLTGIFHSMCAQMLPVLRPHPAAEPPYAKKDAEQAGSLILVPDRPTES